MENRKEFPELDHLKAAWNQDLQQQTDSADFINRQNLLNMMRQRTHTSLSRLKRNLLIEIVSTALILGAIYANTLQTGNTFPPYFWAIVLFVTFYGHIELFIYLRRQSNLSENNLKEALENSIRYTGRFVRFGKKSAWFFSAIVFLGGLQLLFMKQQQQPWSVLTWLEAGFAVLAAVGVFHLIQFYVEKLYGQHFNKLVACHAEFVN